MNNKTNAKSLPSRLRALLAGAVLVTGMGLMTTTANAAAVLVGTVGGVPSGTQYETFDTLALGAGGGALASGITVSFVPSGQAVTGAVSGQYAAPFLSGGNGANFGGQADGTDTTTYLSSGGAGGSATLTFAGQQKYFGLLWGSVDDYNTLTFFSGGLQVAMFTGSDVGDSAGSGDCIGGNQGSQGTCYVNINFLTDSFDTVVATSSKAAFEFDNVAFSALPTTFQVPEPGTAGMFLLGLLLAGSAFRFKGRRA